MNDFIRFISILFIAASAYCSVWQGTRDWQESDLNLYSQWISNSVNHDIFSNPKSEYYGIKTDCADVMYALAIIYSYQNNLNFKVRLKDDQLISNETELFNDYNDQKQRLYNFIHYVAKQSSTYTLAKYNSLPLAIDQIRAGDIYITSFEIQNIETNHAYLIKDILPTGHFELYSSTTPAKVRKLAIRKGYPLHVIKGMPWGFKRVIPYPLIEELKQNKNIYSNEQYEILESQKDFMGHISKMIQTQEDSFENNINFQIENICDMITSRIFEVKEAIYELEKSKRCFKASEYDLYSTPTRDANIKMAFNRLLTGWKKIRSENIDVGEENLLSLEFILGKDKSDSTRQILTKRCPIIVGSNTLNLRDFFYLQYLGKISSNPNDPELTRWGLSSEKSSCKSK